MKIIRLESENIKRLHAVEIKPDGSLVVIGGRNAQGKSSVLDSIEYALAGTSSIPKQPIHKGEHKARVVVELDNIIVTRTFGDSGTKLVVSDKQGFTKSSPQALLDSLVGKLSFDPLEFIRLKSDEQLKVVKQLAGIDLSELEQESKKIFDERTQINREIKSLKSQVEAVPKYDDVPEQELSYSELLQEQETRVRINYQNKQKVEQLEKFKETVKDHSEYMNKMVIEIKKLRQQWDDAVLKSNRLQSESDELVNECNKLEYKDTNSINDQIFKIEETNQKVRSNLKRNELSFDLEMRQKNADTITKRLEEIDNEKLKMLSESKLPISGLTFDNDTLYYNDIPFAEQSSQAEQLRVSVAMGFAMNPKLKILLIRDGSLLDNDNLKMIAEMAAKEGGQLWLERVGEGEECQVIIEDGRVVRG